MRTQLIRSSYLDVYRKKQKITLSKHISKINEEAFNDARFSFDDQRQPEWLQQQNPGETRGKKTPAKYTTLKGLNKHDNLKINETQ